MLLEQRRDQALRRLPAAWDLKLLEKLGPAEWEGGSYEGQTVFETAPAGERVLGWRPTIDDYAHPNLGEDDITGMVERGAALHGAAPDVDVLPRPHLQPLHHPACLAACPRKSIYKRQEDGIVLVDQERCRGYQECVKACPYKKVFYNADDPHEREVHRLLPAIEQGCSRSASSNCIGKIRMHGFDLDARGRPRADNPIDYLVHDPQGRPAALPAVRHWSRTSTTFRRSMCRTLPEPDVRAGGGGAIATYRDAPNDPDLSGLLALFGSSERVMPRWKRVGDAILGLEEDGREIVRVPVREPMHVRPARDEVPGLARTNCP